MVLSIINMCIMGIFCYNDCTKTWSIGKDCYFCVLNPIVLHDVNRKSREHGLITKKYIAMHTNYF